MNISFKESPFPYIYIENFYNLEEYNTLFEEILYLHRKGIFDTPEHTSSAKEEGVLLKDNRGLFIDRVYHQRRFSDILSINRKLFTELPKMLPLNNWFFDNLKLERDYTLVSYYENSHYYKPHKDRSTITALTWFYKEPKSFKGGELVFPEYNITIPCKKNTTLIFPSIIKHAVTEVKMDQEAMGASNGRFVMTQFGQEVYGED